MSIAENPLRKLATFGQSIWLDHIRRHMLSSGQLRKFVAEDGLRGVTSNPAIFEKAITGSHDYDDEIRVLGCEGRKPGEIYERLAVEDVQTACDVFGPLYESTDGRHGFVSLEVSPYLAHQTDETVAEARRLWREVDRPNVLIKVPGTQEGLPAIRQLIREGINVNVTLLFGLPRYREVAQAYLDGLEERLGDGGRLDRVASVASFFLSRIDVLVDPMLEKKIAGGGEAAKLAQNLHGQVAIASATLAYQIFTEIFHSERFRKLADRGARTQRVLWASTSTKNPEYSDVKYVEALVGPETVNTVPLETLDAYRDHGDPAARLEEGLKAAEDLFLYLPELGIDIDKVTQQLEDEGVDKFVRPFDHLMDGLREKSESARHERPGCQTLKLSGYEQVVDERIAELEGQHFCQRLWRKDAALWKSDPQAAESIAAGLGWLHVAEKMQKSVDELAQFAKEVKEAGFRRVVHMGMGGSSLTPLVFERSLAPSHGGLPLTVLDTTDPATIRRIADEAPLEETLFIVASKSGTTAEPRAFEEFFYEQLRKKKGDEAGKSFVAITDPGTPLAELGAERGYRRIFLNPPDIGGRYSALSFFGLVPAALMGLDVGALVDRALRMHHASTSCVPLKDNPGVVLGAALGELALRGRNKVTFIISDGIAALGMWLEQLLAESTGKEGTGLIPIAGEPLGGHEVYGDDRVFVIVRLPGDQRTVSEARLDALREAGHPVITISMHDPLDLGREFLRWEIATATAGAVLGINAFDQPNVQESKDNTNRLLKTLREKGSLPAEEPVFVEGPFTVYASGDWLKAEPSAEGVAGTLARFLAQARPGDYLALLAYLTEEPRIDQALAGLRRQLRDILHLATTVGYGPRYLHSTGQLHKGGPDTGVFLQLTADDPLDAPIPGRGYGFSALKRAQAQGDFEAFRQHGRRVIRIHLSGDVAQCLQTIREALSEIRAEATAAKT